MYHNEELIEGCRQEINGIDKEIVQNIVRRMCVVKQIAEYKKLDDLPIVDEVRERQVIDMARDFTDGLVTDDTRDAMKESMQRIFTTLIEESRRCEITHKLGESVNTAVYVGAPNPNSLFSIDSGSVFKKLDELIDITKKGDDWQRQSYIDKMRTAAVRLHSSLAQINEIFEIHRRLEQAGINIDADKKYGVVIDHSKEFILPEGMTTCVKYHVDSVGSVKYVLCSDTAATVSMDGDGKFYVLTDVLKDCFDHYFHETETVAVELSDIVQTIENYGLDERHIKKSNGCVDLANENTVKNIVEAFDMMTSDVKTYAKCLVSYIDRVLKMNNQT
ncbi:chorismate mutase [Fibrobacter sp.]|uniref:chorismate mutase n=1 Tax=Fibrobacter sp. TaxID=35828 RepID=UPI00386BB19E